MNIVWFLFGHVSAQKSDESAHAKSLAFDVDKVQVWHEKDAAKPKYDEDNFEVVKYCMLQVGCVRIDE